MNKKHISLLVLVIFTLHHFVIINPYQNEIGKNEFITTQNVAHLINQISDDLESENVNEERFVKQLTENFNELFVYEAYTRTSKTMKPIHDIIVAIIYYDYHGNPDNIDIVEREQLKQYSVVLDESFKFIKKDYKGESYVPLYKAIRKKEYKNFFKNIPYN